MKKQLLLSVYFLFLSFFLSAQLSFTNFTSQYTITCLAEAGSHIWAGSTGGLVLRDKINGSLISSYTVNNGLICNYVTDITIDAGNNLWIASKMGIQKFNGTSWVSYTNENTSGGLVENKINTICIDLQGNLWCGTVSKGISKFDGFNWTNYDTLNSGLIDNEINDIAVDNYGYIWIGTYSGVSKFDGINWTTYTTADGLYSNYIHKIFVDPSNIVWFGTGSSLSKYDGSNFSYFYVPGITDICLDAMGNLWLAGFYGAYKFDEPALTVFNSSNSAIDNAVRCVLVDIQGNKWFGCDKGLVKYDNTIWTKFPGNNFMSNNNIHDISGDNSGNTWFATFGGGVTKLTPSNNFINFDTTSGLINNLVHCIAIDSSGNKWFGTTSGLSKFNDTVFTDYLPGNWISSLKTDSNGLIWVATINSGVFVMNDTGAILNSYNDTNSGLTENWIRTLTFDKQGNIWFGTNDSGIVKFHPPGTWTSYNISDGLSSNKIRDFAIDSLNNLWIATYGGGISKFDGLTFTNYNSSNSPLPDDNIVTIAIDNLGNKWIGIDEEFGITKFTGNTWINYSTMNGLAGEHIYKIYIDSLQNIIWVGNENGVSKIACEAPVVNFNADTICFSGVGGITHLINLTTKIDSSSKYSWDVNNDGTTDYTVKNLSYNFPAQGIYPVKLTISNDNCKSSIIKNAIVGLIPGISLNLPDSIKLCYGNFINIGPVILNFDSIFPYKYYWSNGDTTSNINIENPGLYKVTVSDYNCFSSPDSVYADIIQPFSGENICVVSVDSSDKKNIITWEKTANKGISFYNIYKESAVGVYSPLANLPFNSLCLYVDLTSNPTMKSDKYKISVVDTCGNESPLSNFHQTMYLTVNHDLNNVNHLIWNKYEGISFNYFKIYRGLNLNDFQLIDSVQNPVNSFSDSTGLNKKYYYFISVDLPAICDPLPNKSFNYQFSKTLSNISDNGVTHNQGIDHNISDQGYLNIHPNPFSNNTSIEFPNEESKNYTLSVTGITGKVFRIIKNIKTGNIKFDKKELPPGFYIIELSGEKLYRGTVIVQ